MSSLLNFGRTKIPEQKGDLIFEGRAVRIRRAARAKRMILRVDAVDGSIKVTAPPHVKLREIERFLAESRVWIKSQQSKIADVPFIEHGAVLPYLGAETFVCFLDSGPRKVSIDNGTLSVGGPQEQASARLERWLKEQARLSLADDSRTFAEALGVGFSRVSIGDMKSRWGSCSSTGTLRFNWRLIMAPVAVRRYVAAHEVAHLLEMNHSERFWSHVGAVMPGYMRHRRWLKESGNELMKIRFRKQGVDA